MMPRPRLRDLFVRAPKRLEIGFYTSNIDKFMQGRLIFQQYGLILRHFKSSQEPYCEDYDVGQEQLLASAIKEVKHRLGVNSLFFVEDTWVRIDALSTPEKAIPGLDVKDWFARTSFAELDAYLRQHGNDRSATVYSDIALHLPGLNRPIFTHGETKGLVSEIHPDFEKSDQYPWLTPDSFNGWFVPFGATKRLGEMSFEESLEYDFRVKSLVALVDRLEEYAAVLNLAGSCYSVKRAETTTPSLSLFKEDVSLYLVVGKLCAGKTTFGEYATCHHSYRFIEASAIMRMIAEEAGISAPTPFYLARDLLYEKGPDIIARQIVAMYGQDLRDHTIITGFRTIEEVQYIKSQFQDCKIVFIDASERTRFERHLHRGRTDHMETLHEFQEHDRQQWRFGLLRVAQDFADIKIENEGSIRDYYDQIRAVLHGAYEETHGVSNIKHRGRVLNETRIFRCLRALAQLSGPASCDEIAQFSERDAPITNAEHVERISARHVNWILKDIPELVRRIDAKGDKVRYQILPAGRAYQEAIRSMQE